MPSVLRVVLFVSLASAASACGHPHPVYYEPPPAPPEYHHYHRLACDHLVECRYRGGHHHYRPHRGHESYWHVHRTRERRYMKCYVDRKRHDY